MNNDYAKIMERTEGKGREEIIETEEERKNERPRERKRERERE